MLLPYGLLKCGGREVGKKSCLRLEGTVGIYLKNGIPHLFYASRNFLYKTEEK